MPDASQISSQEERDRVSLSWAGVAAANMLLGREMTTRIALLE
jgi:hypothetical protein